MADQKRMDEVGKYIDRYYEPLKEDIRMDKEMMSIFDKITNLGRREPRKGNFENSRCRRAAG